MMSNFELILHIVLLFPILGLDMKISADEASVQRYYAEEQL